MKDKRLITIESQPLFKEKEERKSAIVLGQEKVSKMWGKRYVIEGEDYEGNLYSDRPHNITFNKAQLLMRTLQDNLMKSFCR